MSKIEPRTLQGFFDYFPGDMVLRRHVEETIRKVFISFGYDEINTPSLEYADILFGKYGEDEKLIYNFKDHGDRHVALRYDQTVPLARFIAQHQNRLNFPFKRFEIGRVWRADAARKARKREFVQCDLDIIGEVSTQNDAEVLIVVNNVFKNLGLNKCILNISNRKLLSEIFINQKIKDSYIQEIMRSLDKYDKIGEEGVLKELEEKSKEIKFDYIKIATIIKKLIDLSTKSFAEIKSIIGKEIGTKNQSLTDSEEILHHLDLNGLKEGTDYIFNLLLVRGLDYYTGMVFEVRSKDFNGSFAGGGRYDNLCSMYTENQFQGVGVGIGFEPICAYIEEKNINAHKSSKVLVTIFDKELLPESYKLANLLRENNINTEIYPNADHKIKKQFKYADKKNFKYVIVIGENEVNNKTVILKNLTTGEQEELKLKDLISKLTKL